MTNPDLPDGESAAELLRSVVDLLVVRAGHWSPNRWTQTPWALAADPALAPGFSVAGFSVAVGSTRAGLVYQLVQHLADVGAGVEGQPRRRVPRLEHDPAMTDQVRVLAEDLVRADAPDDTLRAAAAAITATIQSL